jgi:hypothetical protein
MGAKLIMVRPMAVYSDTAPTNSDVFDIADFSEVHALLTVAGVSGTSPSLAVTGQRSIDGNDWADISGLAVAAATTVCSEAKSASTNGFRYVRFKYRLSGTSPSVTFELQMLVKTSA